MTQEQEQQLNELTKWKNDLEYSSAIPRNIETALRERLGLNNVSPAFPIGGIFISVVATDPATLLGYGTWTAFGTGRTLVGIDTGQTEFDVVEETGGEKTHTLSTAELPAHRHGVTAGGLTQHGGANVKLQTAGGSNTWDNETEDAGSGTAHNNLQPYIVVYMWKRTA